MRESRLKIAHIASGDLWAGAEVQIFTLCERLNQMHDVDLRVILLNHGDLEQNLRIIGVPVIVVDETKLNGFRIFLRILKILRSYKPDVLHTHRLKENVIGCCAALLTGRIPNVRTTHGAEEHAPGWSQPFRKVFHMLDYLIGRFVQDRIVVVSEELADITKKYYPKHKIQVIKNGMNTSSTDVIKKQTYPNPDNSKFRIGIVGRLVPVKRVDLFIDIAKSWQAIHPDINAEFIIYGDGPLMEDLLKYRDESGLQSIVQFEGHSNEIYAGIASLDVLVITSDHEGLPMTLLEAMEIGTPVVAHAVGGIPEVLGQNAYGILVDSQEPAEFVTAIHSLIQNPKQTEKFCSQTH